MDIKECTLDLFMKSNNLYIEMVEREEINLNFMKSQGWTPYKYFAYFDSDIWFVNICHDGMCSLEAGDGHTREQAIKNFCINISGKFLLKKRYKKSLFWGKEHTIKRKVSIPKILYQIKEG